MKMNRQINAAVSQTGNAGIFFKETKTAARQFQ